MCTAERLGACELFAMQVVLQSQGLEKVAIGNSGQRILSAIKLRDYRQIKLATLSVPTRSSK